MIKHRTPLKLAFVLIKPNDLNLVLRVLDKGPQRESEMRLWLVAEIYRVQVPVRLVSVYLLSFLRDLVIPILSNMLLS